jgi:hypothetical protein
MLLWLSSRVLNGEPRGISVGKISVEVERAFESRNASGVCAESGSHLVQVEPCGGSGFV